MTTVRLREEDLTCVHPTLDGGMCVECWHAWHAAHADDPAFADCFGCRLRSVQVSPTVTGRPLVAGRGVEEARCSWEAGVAGEHRQDGSFVPYLHDNGEPIGVHEYAGRRGHLDEQVRRLKSDPHVFARERGE